MKKKKIQKHMADAMLRIINSANSISEKKVYSTPREFVDLELHGSKDEIKEKILAAIDALIPFEESSLYLKGLVSGRREEIVVE